MKNYTVGIRYKFTFRLYDVKNNLIVTVERVVTERGANRVAHNLRLQYPETWYIRMRWDKPYKG